MGLVLFFKYIFCFNCSMMRIQNILVSLTFVSFFLTKYTHVLLILSFIYIPISMYLQSKKEDTSNFSIHWLTILFVSFNYTCLFFVLFKLFIGSDYWSYFIIISFCFLYFSSYVPFNNHTTRSPFNAFW